MSKKKIALLSFSVLLLPGMAYYFYSDKDQSDVGREIASVHSSTQTKQKPVTTKHSQTVTESKEEYLADIAPYFEEHVLTVPAGSSLYENSKEILGEGQAQNLISIYIATGIYGDQTAEFTSYMGHLHNQLNAHNEDVYQAIIKNADRLSQDEFTFQMVLNLAGNLEIDQNKKANLLGLAFNANFQVQTDKSIDFSSANMTNALILAKSNDIPLALLESQFKKAMENTSDSSSQGELLARIKTYYPQFQY